MKKSVSGPKLILASRSPRRRNLLARAGIEFSVIPSSFDEESVELSDPDDYVRQLAESKARDIAGQYPASWVIGADTIVFIDDTILGKPGSKSDARTMLKSLSGKTHQVLTGYCVCCQRIGSFFSEAVSRGSRKKRLTGTLIRESLLARPALMPFRESVRFLSSVSRVLILM